MIRRDYLLRMIEQCVQALARILGLVQRGQFDQARAEVTQALHELAELDLTRVQALSEAELLALLIRGEPTQILRQKCLLVVALLRQAGDVYAAQSRPVESRACYLKALNLQLDVLLREEPAELPEFVPRVEALVGALGAEALPLNTTATLMAHYERTGQYAKAEDALFNLLDAQPGRQALIEFGLQFYYRLLNQTDEALALGNLPRAEVENGLAELKSRQWT